MQSKTTYPSAARRTKASRSEAHGGVYPSWVGARVMGTGPCLPRFTLALYGATSALVHTGLAGALSSCVVAPDVIFGATELPHPAFTLCPKTSFSHHRGPEGA